VLRSAAEFGAVYADWQQMAGNPTVDPDFCQLLAATRPEIIRPHIFVVREAGRIAAIWAGRLEWTDVVLRAGYKKIFGLRARCLTTPYGGVLGAERDDVIRFILDHVMELLRAGEADLADFDNVRTDSRLYQVVRQAGPWRCRVHFADSHVHWRMALPAARAEIEKGMSKKHRYWVRRMRKKLQERYADQIQFDCARVMGENWALTEELESVAKHTYQRGLGVGFMNDEEHRRRMELWSKRGLLRAYLLRVEGRPIAFCLGTRLQDSFFLSHTAFLPEMGEFEPGTLIFVNMLEGLCDEGIKWLDFGLGDAFYKQRFGTENWQETQLCLFAPSLKGLWLNATDSGTRLIRHTGRRLLSNMDALKRLKKKWRQKLAKQSSAEEAQSD